MVINLRIAVSTCGQVAESLGEVKWSDIYCCSTVRDYINNNNTTCLCPFNFFRFMIEIGRQSWSMFVFHRIIFPSRVHGLYVHSIFFPSLHFIRINLYTTI